MSDVYRTPAPIAPDAYALAFSALYERHGAFFLPLASRAETATICAHETNETPITLDEIRAFAAKAGPAPTHPDGWTMTSWFKPYTMPASTIDEPTPDLIGEAMRRLWERWR